MGRQGPEKFPSAADSSEKRLEVFPPQGMPYEARAAAL